MAIKEVEEILNYIVLDTETGGLKPGINPMIEFGAICYNGNDLQEMFRLEFFIRNDRNLKIEPKALEANGITMEQINSGVSSKEATKLIVEFLEKANPTKKAKIKPVICGHNIPFDIGFMDELFNFVGVDLFKYIGEIQYDTLNFSRTKWYGNNTLPNYKLGTVVEKSGYVLNNAHSAMGDVEATAEVVKQFIRAIRSEGGGESVNNNDTFRSKFEF